jgi:hypothetical protein
VCDDGVEADLQALHSLAFAVYAQDRPEVQELWSRVRAWLQTCSGAVRDHLGAARDASGSDELLRLLGSLLQMQSVTVARTPPEHMGIVADFLELRETALAETYTG